MATFAASPAAVLELPHAEVPELAALVAAFSSAGVSTAQESRELPPPFPSSVGVPELDDPTVVWLANDQNISRADAARRGAWQLRAELLIEKAGRALGSRFGGIWIDEADHGRIKVGAVGAKAADQEWLDAQGFRGAADIVDVPRSLSDLEAAVDWLWSRAVALNQEAVDRGASWTLAVSITPSRSTANLYVPPAAHRSEQQRAFIEEAQTRLGSALHVEEYETPPHEGACTFSLPPYCDPTPSCRHRHRLPGRLHRRVSCAQPSDNKLYQLTAGHCTRNRENVWWTWFPDDSSHDIGPVHWTSPLEQDTSDERMALCLRRESHGRDGRSPTSSSVMPRRW